ncbi:MAG: phosphoribosylformylglycinamidine synthase [Ruminococcaceae bacterium]|nr:phosphoribosylformylglycinamidine synthase [Oscillospiraceae bacterium]
MVYRIYVEKREGLTVEADALKSDISSFLGIKSVTNVRIQNRYDAEEITPELFEYAKTTVFSEPQVDVIFDDLTSNDGDTVFAVEYLPGQYDQRADSASQCIQIISMGTRPIVRTARIYILSGDISADELARIKKHVINPVESREASLEEKETLISEYDVPADVAVLDGFCDMTEDDLSSFVAKYGLAMDSDDLRFTRDYFKSEGRCPTLTEIKMIDTYWSDHCRHTTFLTTIDNVKFCDPLLESAFERYKAVRKSLGREHKPINLMDLATVAVRQLKADGKIPRIDESEEINACTVEIDVDVEGKTEKWLLLFKNETHNHPTEIEPFGGAATCIGGAIRDPLSGRSYVYAAMRVTGAGDPTKPIEETIPGKLPQKKLVTTAAAGYSSYGNQIGLATGQVSELYHPGYVAKRMEIGAVIAAAPKENVRRECPIPGDIVILLGGRTGRDGCGGATGSSKSHNLHSLESCGAEVQKGNAPEERKLQRLFRNPEASLLIKRCNDFGAGGVSVAIGELADGLSINLDMVPKKYDGLDGTELAISESQERMAVVVAKEDAEKFIALANGENLEATIVASVTDTNRLTMTWRGKTIVDLSREFLNSNGAEKHIDIAPTAPVKPTKAIPSDFVSGMKALASDLNVCSQRGLSERFDSTIGAGTVMMPFGGKYQETPSQAMVHKISIEDRDTSTVSFMAWGYNPYIAEQSPYHSAYLAVVESVSKLIAAGASYNEVYLTFQEYFEKPLRSGERWGKPLAALLGAFTAQLELGIGSIGGKDSMSGSFEDLDVPPTLVSFAVTTDNISTVTTPEFKSAGHKIALLTPEYDKNGLPTADSLIKNYNTVYSLIKSGKIAAAYTPTYGGIAEAIMKMSLGNRIGAQIDASVSAEDLFGYKYGAFVLECTEEIDGLTYIGHTVEEYELSHGELNVCMCELEEIYDSVLEGVYPVNAKSQDNSEKVENICAKEYTRVKTTKKFARPRILIPVFPGTNCEYDTAKALARAGFEPEIVIVRNITPSAVAESIDYFANAVKNAQAIFIPGGFSGGDEPDGSGKFITAFFRNGAVKEETNKLLKVREGLMCGICNGFQAIVKLGLVPYGEIIDTDENCPTLTFNKIGRHQSRIVHTRIASNKSPWLAATQVGEVYNVAISHGEGRFIANDNVLTDLIANGQIATQYTDLSGQATMDINFNPNGSTLAIEGITSPDGRVLGKMGHTERYNPGLYANVPGEYDLKLFESAAKYFR